MSAPHASEARAHPAPLLRAAVLLPFPVLVVVVVARFVSATCDAAVAGSAVAIVTGSAAYHLIRRAWRRRPEFAVGPRPATGWYGVGLGVVALTGTTMTVGTALDVPQPGLADLVAAGLVLATVAFVPGLLLVPGSAATAVARVRRCLDGVGVAISLLFTCWLLVIAPSGRLDGPGFWLALLTCCVVAVAAVSPLWPGVQRRAAVACAAAVTCAVIGLDGFAYALANECPPGWCSVFAVPLLAAAGLARWGLRDDVSAQETPAGDAIALRGHPLLAGPIALAAVVAVHRIATRHPFDPPSVMLGLLAVAIITVRESLAAHDAARYARRIVVQEARFRSLVAGSTDVVMVLDGDLIVRWQSPAAARQLGLSDQEVVGRHFQSMVHPEDAVRVAARLADVRTGIAGIPDGMGPALIEARLRDGSGRWRETESAVSDQRAVPEVSGLVVHIRDISERKEMERALHRLAYADQLTGLANRRQLMMSIVALRCSPLARGALIVVELEGFTAVNDVRGYDIGDAVLVEVARRLRAVSAGTDLAARLSGDEFAVLTEASPVQAYALATRLLTMLAEPICLPPVTVHLSASIGMTDVASAANDDEVMRRADLALRRARQLGRGRVEWYDEMIEEAIARRMTIEQELPDALRRGQVDLSYQPIVDLVTGRPAAVEALVRWWHPQLGTLMPRDVIPAAEDLGLIGEIGSWVLHQACRQLAAWLRDGRDLWMAVNISPHRLFGAELVTDVGTALDLYGFPADRLVLELAEGGLAETAGTEERVGQLRSLGVRIALDDFGTAARSLSHLRRLPIDIVKIGPSLFAGGRPPADQRATADHSVQLINAIVGLGRRIGVEVAAQGLEAPAHLEVVRAAGCRFGQGHLFARPQPAERTEAYLDGFSVRSG